MLELAGSGRKPDKVENRPSPAVLLRSPLHSTPDTRQPFVAPGDSQRL